MFTLIVLSYVEVGRSQTLPSSPNPLADHIQQLTAEQRWADIIRELEHVPAKDAELEYQYGSALAQIGRLSEGRQVFRAGQQQWPKDKRFPIELAGIAFKQKHPEQAARYLRHALRIDPRDTYANDFLGTVYFIAGNLEAALTYWNRIDKPYVERILPNDALRIRGAVLDRALAFSPAVELRLADLETSYARLAGLGVFPSPRIQLAARPENKFDAILNLQERNGFGDSLWQGLISTFSGVAYQTIYPEYFNIRGSATNITSLVRWDAQKRRLAAEFAAPLHANPRWRYRIGFDLRNEDWDIRQSFTGPSPSLGALNLRREAVYAEIDSYNSGRWGWSAAGDFSHRDYRSVVQGSTLGPNFLLEGFQLKQLTRVHYALVRSPEQRFAVQTEAASQIARIWSQPAHAFGKLQGSIEARWFPQLRGDDYATKFQLRGGGASAHVPFDELFMLGMERDNDLWLRAHVGTRDGRKGSAPLGTHYLLANSEIDKNLYSNGLITAKLGPFFDTGRITGAPNLESRKWLFDTGAQATLRVLGVGLTFVYGKDLRTGNNAFYFAAERRAQAIGALSGGGDSR